MLTINIGTLNNIVYYFVNPVIGLLTLTGLTVLWFYFKKPPSIKIIKKAICINLFFIFFKAIYSTIVNGIMWDRSLANESLLEITYFTKYSFNHYWIIPIITVFIAFLIFWLIKLINKKFEERFFFKEEPFLISLGIILSPWPWLIIFLISVVIILFFIQIINLFIKLKKSIKKIITIERTPMIYLWIPSAFLSSIFHFIILFDKIPNEIIFKHSFLKSFFDIFFLFR